MNLQISRPTRMLFHDTRYGVRSKLIDYRKIVFLLLMVCAETF